MENKCGQNIKNRLHDLDMTQADLSRKTGISTATISQYVGGKYFPTQNRLELIANALGTTPADLMGWTVKVPAENVHSYPWTEEMEQDVLNIIKASLDLSVDSRERLLHYAKFLLSEEENKK